MPKVASGNPKRDRTTYGVPPLHPSLLAKGENKLSRAKVEQGQLPDYSKIWSLEDRLMGETKEDKRKGLAEELANLRLGSPRRHPLWAFFHEKTRIDYENEQTDYEVRKVVDKETQPGYYSLAYSLVKPDKTYSTSGTHF